MGGLGRSMDGAHRSYSCAFTPRNGLPSCLEPFQCQSESPEAQGLRYVERRDYKATSFKFRPTGRIPHEARITVHV